MESLKEFKFSYTDNDKTYTFISFANSLEEAKLNIVKFGRRFIVRPEDVYILNKISKRLIEEKDLRLVVDTVSFEDTIQFEDSINETY